MWQRHGMPPFQQVSSSNFCPARAALVNCQGCYCEVEMSRRKNQLSCEVVDHTSSQNGTAECWSKRMAWKNRLSSVATFTSEFQTESRSNVSTSTVAKSVWIPAHATSYSKIMGINMELVPPLLLLQPPLFWEGFPLDVRTLLRGFASIQPQEHSWGQALMLIDWDELECRLRARPKGVWDWSRGSVQASQVLSHWSLQTISV